jgi:hypothetical protein
MATLQFCLYAFSIAAVLHVELMLQVAGSMLSPQAADFSHEYGLWFVSGLFVACVFFIHKSSGNGPLREYTQAVLSLVAVALRFPSMAAAFYALFKVACDLMGMQHPLPYELQCLTHHHITASSVMVLLLTITWCAITQHRKRIFAFIVTSFSYDIACWSITNQNGTVQTSSLSLQLQNAFMCIIGENSEWAVTSAKLLMLFITSVSTIRFMIFTKHLLFKLKLPGGITQALKFGIASAILLLALSFILFRAPIFEYTSRIFENPLIHCLFRPLAFVFCICGIDYGFSVWLGNENTVIVEHIENMDLFYSERLRVSNIFSGISLKPTTYRTKFCVMLSVVLLLCLNYHEPITAIEREILESLWLDFDIIIKLSGSLTFVSIAAMYITWLTTANIWGLGRTADAWLRRKLFHFPVGVQVAGVSAEAPPPATAQQATAASAPPATAQDQDMGRFYFFALQLFVLWWYWKDDNNEKGNIQDSFQEVLKWFKLDFKLFLDLRAHIIICLVLWFNAGVLFDIIFSFFKEKDAPPTLRSVSFTQQRLQLF